MTRTPFRTLPALLVALGVGLCGYYGSEWINLPTYSEADVASSVELNLLLELQRRGPHLQPDQAGLERLRTTIRQEIETDLRRQRDTVELRFGVGLIALVLGFGQLIAGRLLSTRH